MKYKFGRVESVTTRTPIHCRYNALSPFENWSKITVVSKNSRIFINWKAFRRLNKYFKSILIFSVPLIVLVWISKLAEMN